MRECVSACVGGGGSKGLVGTLVNADSKKSRSETVSGALTGLLNLAPRDAI